MDRPQARNRSAVRCPADSFDDARPDGRIIDRRSTIGAGFEKAGADSCRDTTIGPSESTPLSYADAIATASPKVTGLEPPVGPRPSVVLGFSWEGWDDPV